MPIIHSNLLNSDLDWTLEEQASGKKYLKWEEVTLNWENFHMTWDEVFILLEVSRRIGGGGYAYKDYVDGNPWQQVKKDLGEEDTKKLIKVYCRVKGIDYEQVKEPINDIKVTINEFERFVKEAVNVKVGF